MANFPSSTPSFPGFTSSHTLAQDNHAAQHNLEQGEIVALANKVGTGASTPTAGTLLRGTNTGVSNWAQADLKHDVTGILPQANGGTGTTSATGSGAAVYQSAPSLTTPVISGGGSWSGSPALSTPAIADFSNSTHSHSNNAGGGTLNGANAIQAATLKAAEMFMGMVYRRQGGTTGNADWSTAGSNNTDTSAKDVFFQVGSANSSNAGSATVTYPVAYSFVPLVFMISVASGGFSMAQIESNSTTNFTFSSFAAAGTRNNNILTYWISIGQ